MEYIKKQYIQSRQLTGRLRVDTASDREHLLLGLGLGLWVSGGGHGRRRGEGARHGIEQKGLAGVVRPHDANDGDGVL